jgi:hypothetical protein
MILKEYYLPGMADRLDTVLGMVDQRDMVGPQGKAGERGMVDQRGMVDPQGKAGEWGMDQQGME